MDPIGVPRQSLDETIALSSPVTSVFSKGHTSKSSTSSLSFTSSPNPRESFDLYGSKLDKVTEEQEKDGQSHVEAPVLDNLTIRKLKPAQSLNTTDCLVANDYDLYFAGLATNAESSFDSNAYTLGGTGPVASEHAHFKRQRSSDGTGFSLHKRLSSRLGSMSRRLKNRSATGPQLSIITNTSAPTSRAGSISGPILSPAMSAISKHESYLPSPTQDSMHDSVHSAFPDDEEMLETVAHMPPATTPLLPPVFTETAQVESPIQSPLQSPSIAPTPAMLSSRVSLEINGLPSPPLSTKPSMISVRQRSRANTATAPIAEIPPLQLVNVDPWSAALGHANFSIHPEPYLPSIFDLDAYADFRNNWDDARRNYTKHLARTHEHNGPTSKVYKLTEEKWATIDKQWKEYHARLEFYLAPQLKRASDHAASDSSKSSLNLEKPISKIVMPEIDDKCGKFPELGDGDIVGPMEVGPPRSAATSPTFGPFSPRKRTWLRYLQDMLAKA